MSTWKVTTLQIHPILRGQTRRYDVLALDAFVERFEKEGHKVEVEEALSTDYPVVLPHRPTGIGSFSLHGATFTGLMADGMVAEELDTERFWVIDYQDCDSGPGRMLADSPNWQGSILTMFHRPSMKKNYGPLYEKIWPGNYSALYPSWADQQKEEVQAIRKEGNLDKRLFFAGTINGETPDVVYTADGVSVRGVGPILREKYPDEVRIESDKESMDVWLLGAAKHQVCLTLPGHPWCSREHELFLVGIPILTYEWKSDVQHPWLTNFHYTTVEGLERHSMGFPKDFEQGADALIKRHREVVNRPELLEHRARQGQIHYEAYFRPEKFGDEWARQILTAAAI